LNRLKLAILGLLILPSLAQAQVPAQAPAQAPAPKRLTSVEAPPAPMTAKIDLGAEFPQMQGYTFTQSYQTVAPGAGRTWHSHAGMPEIVRILSGVLTDARNGEPPKTYGPGSTLINAGGTEHMWANFGTEPVIFVATAIRSPGK